MGLFSFFRRSPDRALASSAKDKMASDVPSRDTEALPLAAKASQQTVGPYEYHLIQRRNNPLFPEERRTVGDHEWAEARIYDDARRSAYNSRFAELFADYALNWGTERQVEKYRNKTMKDMLEDFLSTLTRWDSVLEEYAFVNGTSGWSASNDELFTGLLKFRENVSVAIRKALLYMANEDGIRTHEEWQLKTNRDRVWQHSHFYQVVSRQCAFLRDEDLWPRLLSESDDELKAFLSFAQSEPSVRNDGFRQLLAAHFRCQAMKDIPVTDHGDTLDLVKRHFSLIGGLVSKGEILGVWRMENDALVFSHDAEVLLASVRSSAKND